MPLQWLRQPHVILSRLVGLSTTVWLFRKVGCWARSLTRLGALLLRFARRGRLGRQLPDYGHLLQGALYPGNPPSLEAASTARSLAEEAAKQTSPEEAFRLLREAVLLCPPDPSIYLARAQTHLRWQRNVEALDDAELCVSLDGQCVQGWLAKGKAEQLLGRSADAAASFQAGLDLEPLNVELQSQLTAVRAEPPPNLIMQFKDLVFAARLGLENLFRTLEDPERVTDVYIESNAELLDAQVGLLAQTLHVNKVVLFDSPRLCDAYEQIVFACSQLITGAPAAFSKCLSNAPSVVEGMSLAMRLGWLVHHSIGKLAANALLSLACCPTADDQLRRSAVRQLLGGLLRWLLDARPESDREVEEVCGCSCSVPWKAAACFLERLFEPGRPQPWIREECEAWPDSVLLCQWLMLSVRDYHATPLGLVGLLQMSGVAASTMQSKAVVDFFIAPPPFLEEDLEPEDGEEEELLEDEVYEEPSHDHSEFMEEQVWEAARASGMPWWRAAQVSRQPHRMLRRQHARAAAAAASAAAALEAAANAAAAATERGTSGSSSSSSAPPAMSPIPAPLSALTIVPSLRWGADPPPPEGQRLGEWMMASLGYLFLFIEGDALFTVCACRALQTLAQSDPEGNGRSRLLQGLWLGVPLLSKLSLVACNHTAALDLLHCLFQTECPVARSGIRAAVRSLAHALAGDSSPPSESINELDLPDPPPMHTPTMPQDASSAAAAAMVAAAGVSPSAAAALAAAVAVVTASEGGNAEAAANMGNLLPPPEEDMVPSWAEFHHELLQELASPAPRGTDESGKPELVTLFNFESKASLLAEHAVVRVVFPEVLAKVQVKCKDDDLTNEQLKRLACFAVPAAWNLHASALASQTQDFQGSEAAAASAPAHWQAVSTQRFRLFHERERENMAVGSEEYVGDKRKMGQVILMSRRSIRLSHRVHNWAQAVAAAEQAGASAVVVYNDLDGMEPFRMGLFGEKPPSIPAFMVSGRDGAALGLAAARDCDALIVRSVPLTSFPSSASSSSSSSSAQSLPRAAPWPLSGGRLLPDVAQAWSLLEALSAHGEPGAEEELGKLLLRMSVPEKRVWLTRRLVRHHRAQQAADSPEGDLADPPLAFVEGDRWLSPEKQLTALRQQMCEAIGIGSEDICGEFEVRFHGEQGVGSAVVREWMDLVAREAFLNPKNRILRSFDRRQTFWPDAAAPFCNDRWRMDYEILGRLVGLALWQSCTLDLPLHPHVCALLFGFPRSQLSTSLAEVDEDLERLKVRWLLSNPVDDLGFQMPFSDPLCSEDQLLRESAAASSSEEVHEDRRQTDEREAEQTEQESQQGQEQTAASLPELVRLDDRLPGQERAWSERPLLRVGAAEVALGEAEEGEIVTDDNKAAFAEALTEWRLFGSVDLQVQAMAKGLGKVLPEELRREMRSLLSPLEIAQLLSGLGGEVSVDDWEAHTSYTHGLNRESNVVNWFWEVVRAWAASPEDSCRLPQLLQFVTGSARVPVGGFSELVGFNGSKHAFTLAGGSHLSANALPMAHACICTLDIPPYQDFETCKTKMTQMLQMGRQHFDEAAGRGDGD
eukprot:TRINITY_DN5950_c0_g1_i1.p1 TRINITY_DN5950_c0_g1~~TRINITY_DN5950_c0_g1_i1.p1  ORF type:complete len:1569 (-),score=409.53 TRINITY_DN5950_c0_g1_i1:132-4838(-)